LAPLLDAERLRTLQGRVEEAYRTLIFLESRVAYDRHLLDSGLLKPDQIRGLHAEMAHAAPATPSAPFAPVAPGETATPEPVVGDEPTAAASALPAAAAIPATDPTLAGADQGPAPAQSAPAESAATPAPPESTLAGVEVSQA